MKKRNAFTLVELLGIIVVLSILALITIPIISNVISDVRIKALKSSAYGLIESSNLYYAQYGNSSNIRFDINDNKVSSSDTDNLISYKGSIKSGTIILDKKGNVTVCITDGKNSAYKNYNEKKVTTSKGKICSIKENSSIVYLDDEATITQYDNAKLTELIDALTTRVDSLESENETLKTNLNTANEKISSLESENTTLSTTLASKASTSDLNALENSLSAVDTNLQSQITAINSSLPTLFSKGYRNTDVNLNTITDTGWYCFGNGLGTNAAFTNETYLLLVFKDNSTGFIVQIQVGNSKAYMRKSSNNGSTWRSWYQLY